MPSTTYTPSPVAIELLSPLSCLTGPIYSAVFHTIDQSDELAAWLREHSDTAGLYYSLNEPRPGADSKLSKMDVANIRGVVIDIDPRVAEEMQSRRLRARAQRDCGNWPINGGMMS